MQTFLRITLLGLFAAAGISAAVGVAISIAPGTSDSPSPVFNNGDVAGPITPTQPESQPPSPPSLASYHPTVANQVERTSPHVDAATFATQQQQDRIQRLEDSLKRAEDAARQSQIDRLEMALGQVQNVAQQNEQRFHNALNAMQQTPLPTQAGPQPAPRQSTVSALAQNIRLDENEEDEAENNEGQDQDDSGDEFHKDEGDGQLTINAKKTDVRDLLHWLSEQGDFNIVASQSVKGVVSISLSDIDVKSALDAVLNMTGFVARREDNFIYVGTPSDLEKMDHLRDKIGTRIYRTNYVKASEIQTLITPLLSKEVGKTTVSSPAEIDIPADTVHTGGDAFAGNEVLMVRDYEAVLLQIDQYIAQIDIRPLQVSIEAMILSVNLDDSNVMGVNFEILRDDANVRLVSGSPLTSLATLDVASGGLNFGFLDSSLTTFVEALETVGDTNVIATPRLLCLNKQRAEILIGQQRGYLTTTQTETATTQSVEFLEVGTQLRIRPYISQDGMIRMDIHPELSTGDIRLLGGFALPDKEVTQVTTNIICRDGGTVIIGGLIRNELGTTTSQIPLLGNMPLVGALFRHKTETVTRNEIIVLITPRIVGDSHLSFEGQQTVAELDQRNSNYADQMSPLGKRHYGRRYFRMAMDAHEQGDARRALRFINLSIHYDPLNQEAINFRNEIVGDGETEIFETEIFEAEEIHEQPIQGVPLEEIPLSDSVQGIRSSRRQQRFQNLGSPPIFTKQ